MQKHTNIAHETALYQLMHTTWNILRLQLYCIPFSCWMVTKVL